MNDAELSRLREAAWRRDLTAEESARLAGGSEADEPLWEDLRLGQALRALPPVPVPSNFTARVMQTIERETGRTLASTPSRWSWKFWRRWLPRLAVGGALCVVVAWGWRQHQESRRQQLASSLQQITALAAVPVAGETLNVEVWQNFDVIRRMSGVGADEELLTVAKSQQ